MTQQNKVRFNAQNIKAETAKAVLINMPHKSNYDGFCFWVSAKLVRDAGGKGYFKTFSFTDEFEFKLLKFGNGRYNSRDVISEKTITAAEMIESFSSESQIKFLKRIKKTVRF